MFKFIGTVTDPSFKESLRLLDIPFEDKVALIRERKFNTDQMIEAMVVHHYQEKRIYLDEFAQQPRNPE